MNFGQRLKYFREKAGYKRCELSEQCGLSGSYLSKLEKMGTIPTQSTLEKLSLILDIPVLIWLIPCNGEAELEQIVKIYKDTGNVKKTRTAQDVESEIDDLFEEIHTHLDKADMIMKKVKRLHRERRDLAI